MSRRPVGLALVWLVAFAGTGVAQQTCQVIRAVGAGALQVRCGTDTLLAITKAMQVATEQSDNERLGALDKLAAKDSIIATFERERALADTTLARKNAYIAELEQLSDGYKKLAGGYKKLAGSAPPAIPSRPSSPASASGGSASGAFFRRATPAA
jgi:hypothetical protein